MERQGEDFDSLQYDGGRLAQLAFPGHRVLFSETFLHRSRESYGPEWLVREIVQNFVDANRNSPGTLDGVGFTKTALPNGKTRYVITGNWPFKDYTGLVYLHSDKIDETVNTAGGNGIGIKQSALRMMRDYGVSRFSIIGEGWNVDYCFASSRGINDALHQQGIPHRVKNGFLMVHPQKEQNTGRCFYVIETTTKNLPETLDRFYDLGVCRQNSHLSEMSYENPAGAIKWLPLDRKGRMQFGKLFVNGQISRCKNIDPSTSFAEKYVVPNGKDYWGGPEGMTIRLNDVKQRISMDRPPVGFNDLSEALQNFINRMSKEDLIKNLLDSEYIWSSKDHEFLQHHQEYFFCFRFISQIVHRLHNLGFSKKEYEKYFGKKAYYCVNRYIGAEQAKELRKQGYRLCPACFYLLNMPSVPPIVEPRLAEHYERPHLEYVEAELFIMSQKYGVDVPYKKVKGKNAASLARKLKGKFPDEIGHVEELQDPPNTLYILLNDTDTVNFGSYNLASKEIIHSPEPCDRFLCFLRGMVFTGLTRGIFKDVVLFSKGYFTTFSADARSGILGVRNISREHNNHAIQIIFNSKKSCADFKKELERKIVLPENIRVAVKIAAACILAGAVAIVVKPIFRPENEKPADSSSAADIVKDVRNKTGTVKATTETTTTPLSETADNTTAKTSDQKLPPASSFPKIEIDNLARSEYILGKTVRQYYDTGVEPSNAAEPEQEDDKSTSDLVEDLKIEQFTPKQKQQLELLREYVYLLTDYWMPGSLFIYSGKGANGINIGGNIGFHEKVMETDFETALTIFNHEIAHNIVSGHGKKFIRANSAIHAEQSARLTQIAQKACSGQDAKMKKILAAKKNWNRLKKHIPRGR